MNGLTTLAAILVLQGAPPAPPIPGSHLFPAPSSETIATGRCGRTEATVRVSQAAAAPGKAARQSVTITVGGSPVVNATAVGLDAAIAKFGAITHVGVYCSAGAPARVELHGPIGDPAGGPAGDASPRRPLFVDLDGSRIAAIR